MNTLSYTYIAEHPCKELSQAFIDLSISFKELDSEDYALFLNRFLEKYSQISVYEYPIWEYLNPNLGFSIVQDFAWLLFDVLLKDQECIVFFDLYDSPSALKIPNGAVLKEVLENCSTFNFYVSNSELSFYYAYNDDHGILSAGGRAIESLKKQYLQPAYENMLRTLDQKELDWVVLEQQILLFFDKIRNKSENPYLKANTEEAKIILKNSYDINEHNDFFQNPKMLISALKNIAYFDFILYYLHDWQQDIVNVVKKCENIDEIREIFRLFYENWFCHWSEK
ncbi:MAG: hypothetical protein EAZ97_10900 [Bacteroidetes bacterium]|nr:MAG: hypothetical protein EAZ97_10900 [Bacteroidota bacterium]